MPVRSRTIRSAAFFASAARTAISQDGVAVWVAVVSLRSALVRTGSYRYRTTGTRVHHRGTETRRRTKSKAKREGTEVAEATEPGIFSAASAPLREILMAVPRIRTFLAEP